MELQEKCNNNSNEKNATQVKNDYDQQLSNILDRYVKNGLVPISDARNLLKQTINHIQYLENNNNVHCDNNGSLIILQEQINHLKQEKENLFKQAHEYISSLQQKHNDKEYLIDFLCYLNENNVNAIVRQLANGQIHMESKDKRERNIIMLALENKSFDKRNIKIILENIPELNQNKFIDAEDVEGMSVLMYAIKHTSPLMVRLLLDHGSNLLHKDKKGFSILDYISSDPEDARSDHPYFIYRRGNQKYKEDFDKCCEMILEEINKRNINLNLFNLKNMEKEHYDNYNEIKNKKFKFIT